MQLRSDFIKLSDKTEWSDLKFNSSITYLLPILRHLYNNINYLVKWYLINASQICSSSYHKNIELMNWNTLYIQTNDMA